jgi:hypothetical protein
MAPLAKRRVRVDSHAAFATDHLAKKSAQQSTESKRREADALKKRFFQAFGMNRPGKPVVFPGHRI